MSHDEKLHGQIHKDGLRLHGQIVEWPEVVTEGKTIEECREMLKDALHEIVLAYGQRAKRSRLAAD